MRNIMPTSMLPLAVRIIAYLFLASVILTSFKLLSPFFMTEGLDPSWRAALLQVRLLGLGFGNQVVFTGGPLSHVYTQTFSSQLFYENILSTALFAIFYALFVINAASRSESILAAAIGTLPFMNNSFLDPLFLGLPFCASLLGTLPVQTKYVRLLVAIGAIASAVATLAKFSVFPVAILGFLIVDLIASSRRRLPIALIVYGFTLLALFRFTSPSGSLLEYFRGSLEAVAGYSEAMSISGPTGEVGMFLAAALTLLGLSALSEFQQTRCGELPAALAVARVAILGVFLVLCAKAGFVRHDRHALIGWAGLALATGSYCAFSWGILPQRLTIVFVVLTLVTMVCPLARLSWQTKLPIRALVSLQFAERQTEYTHWIHFISGPGNWLAKQRATEKAACERIHAQHPWPQLAGTVDTIANAQSTLIANGLRYQPRPTLQEYTTYTRRLIERNKAFFRSDQAPDFLLMVPGSIDLRHPAFAEGPIWPDLLARYAPDRLVEGMALLRKRDRPIDLRMRVVRTLSGVVNQSTDLTPLPQGTIFARIDVQPTLWGRLAGLVFKSAPIFMDVRYSDGTEARYRFIPAIAREGFVLSPLIASQADYVSLALGEARANPQKVSSIAIRPAILAKWLWSETFTIQLEMIEDEALRPSVEQDDASEGLKPALSTGGTRCHRRADVEKIPCNSDR
jgi:hypothetical protein